MGDAMTLQTFWDGSSKWLGDETEKRRAQKEDHRVQPIHNVGDDVEAVECNTVYGDDNWHPARITKVNLNGTYDITWREEGTQTSNHPVRQIRKVLHKSQRPTPSYQCKWCAGKGLRTTLSKNAYQGRRNDVNWKVLKCTMCNGTGKLSH